RTGASRFDVAVHAPLGRSRSCLERGHGARLRPGEKQAARQGAHRTRRRTGRRRKGCMNRAFGSATACLVLLTGIAVSGCGKDAPPQKEPSAATGMHLDADYTGAGQEPGALSEATTLPTIDRRLRSATSLAARIEYTSTSGVTGGTEQVTGT